MGLSLLYVFTHELQAQLPPLPDYVDSQSLAPLCVDFKPENTAPVTGVSADNVRELAKRWLSAESAVCYGRMGVSVQAQGGIKKKTKEKTYTSYQTKKNKKKKKKKKKKTPKKKKKKKKKS